MKILGLMISAGLVLVILGIVLSIGAKITSDVRDDMPTTSTDVDNETHTFTAADEVYTLAGSNVNFGNYTGVEAWNGTDIVHQNNFTWTYSTVTIKTDEFNNEELNISYTYTNGSTAWTAAQDSTIAISNLSEWEGTIATVI